MTAMYQRPLPIEHATGCPANDNRVETYENTSPEGDRFTVTRCGDCAAHATRKQGE